MSGTTSSITIQNKKYDYTVKSSKEGTAVIHFVCKAAKIDQDFLAEDIASLIIDLPQLIVAQRTFEANQSEVVRFRVSATDKKNIEKQAAANGFDSVSDYLRSVALVS